MPGLLVLLASFTVAIAAYVGHVVVRGTKISEFRQKWVDDQRADLAIIIARAYAIEHMRRSGDGHDAALAQALAELEEAAFRVKLRENPRRPEWEDVLRRIDSLRDAVHADQLSRQRIGDLGGDIAASARLRLKAEWGMVRDGEQSYRKATKWFRWLLGLALAAALALTALTPLFWPEPPARIGGTVRP